RSTRDWSSDVCSSDLGDAGVISALNTLLTTGDVVSGYPLAAFILAASIGLSRARIVPAWYGSLGFLAGLIALLHGTNWATSGFRSEERRVGEGWRLRE